MPKSICLGAKHVLYFSVHPMSEEAGATLVVPELNIAQI